MLQRREFLGIGIGGSAAMLWEAKRLAASAESVFDPLNVALLGAGVQGRTLMQTALLMPGIRFRAVCDIWNYSRNAARNYLATYKQEANEYADYREMLNKQKDLHAVLVATPDFLHAEHAIACLEAGLHVYCEKPLATSLDAARKVVHAVRTTGKLLQVGYQRRSNPRYLHVVRELLQKAKLVGRLTHVEGAWYQPIRDEPGWPKKFAMRPEDLQAHGYADMQQFRSWRAYRKFSAGRFADFGAQQVDVIGWVLGGTPKSVLAGGGTSYYAAHQWPDSIVALLEYTTAAGPVYATCQVQTTTSGGGEGSFEHFMGTEGSIRISENPKWTRVFREAHAPSWDDWVRRGLLASKEDLAAKKPATSEEEHVRETGVVVPYELPVVLDKPLCQPHLENFFDAVRGKAQLTCPPEEAFRTEVVVHKVNEALDTQRMIRLDAADFAL